MFSAKAPKRIMASKVLAKAGVQVEDFIGGIVELGDRLGPLVWQFDRDSKIEADDFAAFLGLLPKKARGRALRHVLDVRDPDFDDVRSLALERHHSMATMSTDHHANPSFANVTADFVTTRRIRQRASVQPA